jgi:hypothetical protein
MVALAHNTKIGCVSMLPIDCYRTFYNDKFMTRFENFLIDKGYIMYVLDCKEMKYKKAKQHIISTMVNLDHRYIHNSDTILLDKINKGKSVMDDDFTWDDRRNEICFGLREYGKPPTLISPRPRIRIKTKDKILTEQDDDAMNIVFLKIDYEDIFKAMYDKSIIFDLDLRTNIT